MCGADETSHLASQNLGQTRGGVVYPLRWILWEWGKRKDRRDLRRPLVLTQLEDVVQTMPHWGAALPDDRTPASAAAHPVLMFHRGSPPSVPGGGPVLMFHLMLHRGETVGGGLPTQAGATLCCSFSSASISCSRPVTTKMMRSHMLVMRSPIRSRLWPQKRR
jgi:hypothetical protein